METKVGMVAFKRLQYASIFTQTSLWPKRP